MSNVGALECDLLTIECVMIDRDINKLYLIAKQLANENISLKRDLFKASLTIKELQSELIDNFDPDR